MLKDSYYARSLLLTVLAIAGFGGALAGFIYLTGYVALCVIVALILLCFAWLYRPWQNIGCVTITTTKVAVKRDLKNTALRGSEKQATKVKG